MVFPKIKIAQEPHSNKPVFLLKNGELECGNFKYKGKLKSQYQRYYNFIFQNANHKPKKGILDVSQYKYWNSTRIYDQYIVKKWQKSISVGKILSFSNETKIRTIINSIKSEFVRAVNFKWKKVFKQLDP